MHQKVVAAVERCEIFEGKSLKYTAKKKVLAAGADLDIFDAFGNKAALVDQKVLSMVKTFDISINCMKCGTVKKKFPALTKDMNYVETVTLDDEKLTVGKEIAVSYEDVTDQLGNTYFYYRITDIFNNSYYTESVSYDAE